MKANILSTFIIIALTLLSACGSSNKVINCYSFSNGKNQKSHLSKFDFRKNFKKRKTAKKDKNQSITIENTLDRKNSIALNSSKKLPLLKTKNSLVVSSTERSIPPFSNNNSTYKKEQTPKIKPAKSSKKSQPIRKHIANFQSYEMESTQGKLTFVKSKESVLLLSLGLLGTFMAGLFWFNHFKLQRISLWAAKNPKKTIIAIGSIKTFLMLGGLFLGRHLAENEFAFSDSTRNILLGTYLATALFYPAKKSLSHIFHHTSFRQKIYNLTLLISGFFAMICLGNKRTVEPNFSTSNNFIFQTYDKFSKKTLDESTVFKNKNIQNSPSNDSANSSKNNQLSKGAKVGITIMASIMLFFLLILVAYFACGLSCNGQEALALLVGLGGSAGLVVGYIFILTSIYKKS